MCRNPLCQNGGTCINTVANDYRCDCMPGYTGKNCQTGKYLQDPECMHYVHLLHVVYRGRTFGGFTASFFFYEKSSILLFLNTEMFLSWFRIWYCLRIEWYEWLFMEKLMSIQEDRISWPDTARQCVWEREKMSQSQAMLLCVCFTHLQFNKWLGLVVFDPYFLVAE